MDLFQAITERRSIHTFQTRAVPEDVLTDIFSYGTWAPTHYMKEPWNIKVYQGEGKTAFVSAILASYERIGMLKADGTDVKSDQMKHAMRDFLTNIPHHVLIHFPINDDPIRYEEDYAAVCSFIQTIQLAAWAKEVGMLWTITPYMHDPMFAKEIGLGEDEKIAAVMQVGYPYKVPINKGRTPIEKKLTFVNS